MYFVSRQHYWGVEDEAAYVVEVASGGLDYAGPDMLVPCYPGEGIEYEDPREAVEAAIEICRRWREDGQPLAQVAAGNTWGGDLPLEPADEDALRQWAQEKYANLPKCDWCGGLLPRQYYGVYGDDEGRYCSEYCAEQVWAQMFPDAEEED